MEPQEELTLALEVRRLNLRVPRKSGFCWNSPVLPSHPMLSAMNIQCWCCLGWKQGTHHLASNPTIVEPVDDDMVMSSGDEFNPLAEDYWHNRTPKARWGHGRSICISWKEAAHLADPNNGQCLLIEKEEPMLLVQTSHLLDQATVD